MGIAIDDIHSEFVLFRFNIYISLNNPRSTFVFHWHRAIVTIVKVQIVGIYKRRQTGISVHVCVPKRWSYYTA